MNRFSTYGDDYDEATVRRELRRFWIAAGMLAHQIADAHVCSDGCTANRVELVNAVVDHALAGADELLASETPRPT